MRNPRRPAAYVRVPAPAGRPVMTAAADQRGWNPPVIYADSGDAWQAHDRLMAAITAGRHDGLLVGVTADPLPLMRLLLHCTRHGVTVSFVTPPGRELPNARSAAGQGVSAEMASTSGVARDQPGHAQHGSGPAAERWDVLARARLEALIGLFPAWRIWLDHGGWHARRRSDGYLQGYRPGGPAYYVSAASALDLAAQLCWQRAADQHAPDGCQSRMASPPPWGGFGADMQRAM